MNITYLGLVAGILTTASGIPQVVKSYRTRKVRDISVWQPVLLIVGMALWLAYGILLRDLPLIVANSVSLLCYTLLLIMKFSFRDEAVVRTDFATTTKTTLEEE